MDHYNIHKYHAINPILSQIKPVHSVTSYLLKLNLNVILPSTPRFSHWSLTLMFSHQTFEWTSDASMCVECLAHFILLNHALCKVQVMKLIITQFSLLSGHLHRLSTLFSKYPQSMFLP
jgi:hypothetical protein